MNYVIIISVEQVLEELTLMLFLRNTPLLSFTIAALPVAKAVTYVLTLRQPPLKSFDTDLVENLWVPPARRARNPLHRHRESA